MVDGEKGNGKLGASGQEDYDRCVTVQSLHTVKYSNCGPFAIVHGRRESIVGRDLIFLVADFHLRCSMPITLRDAQTSSPARVLYSGKNIAISLPA